MPLPLRLKVTLLLALQKTAGFLQRTISRVTRGSLPPFCGVWGIVEDQGRLLVIERVDGLGVHFPGGFVDTYEDPEDAVVRELAEETGLTVVPRQLIGAYGGPATPVRSVTLAYLCEITAGTPQGSFEGRVFWLPLEEAPQRIGHHCQRALVDYLKWRQENTAG